MPTTFKWSHTQDEINVAIVVNPFNLENKYMGVYCTIQILCTSENLQNQKFEKKHHSFKQK